MTGYTAGVFEYQYDTLSPDFQGQRGEIGVRRAFHILRTLCSGALGDSVPKPLGFSAWGHWHDSRRIGVSFGSAWKVASRQAAQVSLRLPCYRRNAKDAAVRGGAPEADMCNELAVVGSFVPEGPAVIAHRFNGVYRWVTCQQTPEGRKRVGMSVRSFASGGTGFVWAHAALPTKVAETAEMAQFLQQLKRENTPRAKDFLFLGA
jgi:hypothetical protein